MSTTVIRGIVLGALALLAVPTIASAQGAPPPPPPPPGSPPPPPGYGYPAATSGPDRSGMTFELSLGLGITSVAPDNGDGESYNGLSGLNLGVGGWISPNTALTVRIAGTSFHQDFGGVDVQLIAGLLGITAQQYVNDQMWVGGGVGIGILTDDQDETEAESGLGLDLRAGYNFYQSTKNAFNVALEITPGFFDGGRVTGIGLQVGWQAL
jgi:hypothetical protein